MLKSEVRDGFIYLTLDHEDRGNSFGSDEEKVLAQILKQKSPRPALILRGQGSRFFCTGGNLQEQARASSSKAALQIQKRVRQTLENLSRSEAPTVALVNGDCFGGGLEVLSAFDHVIATPYALFGFWQRKLGLSYGWGGGVRLLNRLSKSHLISKTQTAEVFTAQEALRIGLVDEISPEAELEIRALRWLSQVQAHPEGSYSKLKLWLPKNDSKTFDSLWMNPRHKETVQRFKKKK